ncbi:MAG: Flp pilus assembly complex ATPase component TadA [Phycisphaeraceae bacterium]|nr:Flp pilus assembly complex ATPase component TadA [Phycisphaeraceae bacterium]
MLDLQHSISAMVSEVAGPAAGRLSARRAEESIDAWLDRVTNSGVDADQLGAKLAPLLQLPHLEQLNDRPAFPEFIERIPIGFARERSVIGLAPAKDSEPVIAAVGKLSSLSVVDGIGRMLGRSIAAALAPRQVIEAKINASYETSGMHARQLDVAIHAGDSLAGVLERVAREDLLDVASQAPVIQLVNLLLLEAYKQSASDIHLQPFETHFVARLRIDGVLHDCFRLPKASQEAIVSRVKVMGRMNIAEKRLPQDGRASVQVGGREIDLRIASLPSQYGERVVIRLLDKGSRRHSLGDLGMNTLTLNRFRIAVNREHGIVLVTGPTGSGKTTTLYATLDEINDHERNIITLEDPIEYQLPGVSQTQVNEKKGLTFASGLRSVLRQDPDIIMVGEIRDRDTAAMAIQSALTGHLVFSTLHTNDAASAVVRLLDLGVEPYLVSSSVVAVLAQRLLRKLCRSCTRQEMPTSIELQAILAGHETVGREWKIHRACGCEICRQTGFRGRVGIFELLTVDDEIRADIQSRATTTRIKMSAVAGGMQTLREDGVRKVVGGITTLEEVNRITLTTESHGDTASAGA